MGLPLGIRGKNHKTVDKRPHSVVQWSERNGIMPKTGGTPMYLQSEHKVWLATGETPVYLEPSMANRHGLIAGATGTGMFRGARP